MGKPRDLSARIVLVNDVALCRLHQFRLGAGHRPQRGIAIAALDRLFDGADRAAHLGAARLIDNRAASNLARRLLGGSCVGHALKYPSAVTDRGWSGLSAPAAQPSCSTLVFFRASLRMPWSERICSRTAPLKEQRRQDCPAAIGVLIEGASCSVNAFRGP